MPDQEAWRRAIARDAIAQMIADNKARMRMAMVPIPRGPLLPSELPNGGYLGQPFHTIGGIGGSLDELAKLALRRRRMGGQ
jgi:hypothetical protein